MDGSAYRDFFKMLPWLAGVSALVCVGAGFLLARCL